MKRGLIIICACLLIVSSFFSGCGTSDTQGTTEEVTQATEEQTSEATSEEVTETQEETTEKAEEASVSEESPVTYEYTQVDDGYFNDAVFIGDSISYGFELYVTEKRANGETVLGEAKFLTSGSLSYGNSLWDVSDESVHPTYNGVKMKLEDAIAQIKPGKI